MGAAGVQPGSASAPADRRDGRETIGEGTAEQVREEAAVRHAGREQAPAVDAPSLLEHVEERPDEVDVSRLASPEVPATARRPEQLHAFVALRVDGDEALLEGERPPAAPPAVSPGTRAKPVQRHDDGERSVGGAGRRVEQIAPLHTPHPEAPALAPYRREEARTTTRARGGRHHRGVGERHALLVARRRKVPAAAGERGERDGEPYPHRAAAATNCSVVRSRRSLRMRVRFRNTFEAMRG